MLQYSSWSTILLFTSFSDFTNHRKKSSILQKEGWYFLAVDLSPTFLNTETTNETFQQAGTQDIPLDKYWKV